VFRVTGDDGSPGGTVTDQFDVFVADDATDITAAPPSQNILEDTTFSFDVQARDEEVERGAPFANNTYYTLEVDRVGDAIPYQLVNAYNANNGPGADVIFNADTGRIIWSVSNVDAADEYNFRVVHHDSFGSTDTETFTLTIVNSPPVFTTTPTQGGVLYPNNPFRYDAGSTDEGQHDWRGDDNVEYSLVAAPAGMTIDPDTGVVRWGGAPRPGNYGVLILVDDGNGGFALQGFRVRVDPFPPPPPVLEDLPPRLDTGPESKEPEDLPKPGRINWDIDPVVLEFSRDEEPGLEGRPNVFGDDVDEWWKKWWGRDLEQPELEIGGDVFPLTPLAGHPDEVESGKKLDFNAEEILLWDGMDLKQPNLDIGGSIEPATPLEGHGPQVDAGKRLDFEFKPIEETMEFDVERTRVADILGLS
jgi:hypothetical protein